ncbi:hypothetical protein MY4038_009856 [Beauveria bassiana]
MPLAALSSLPTGVAGLGLPTLLAPHPPAAANLWFMTNMNLCTPHPLTSSAFHGSSYGGAVACASCAALCWLVS